MLDSLDELKHKYESYGGKHADFVSQVRDMENYLYFNRSEGPIPAKDRPDYYPYQRMGNATVVAKNAALPPFGYGAFPYHSPFVDHDRKMMRTHLIS